MDRIRSAQTIPRRALPALLDSLRRARVSVISGPRQAGKTTLARQLVDRLGRGTLRDLDDPVLLQAATDDPVGFVATGERPLVIDEVQRGGDALVRAVKRVVDRDPAPGQFVLTGSSNFLTVPTISESLAGRAAFVELWPFTQGEIARCRERFLDLAFGEPDRLRRMPRGDLDLRGYLGRLCAGGFPEAQRLAPGRRDRWFRDYVRTVTQRDIVELSHIRKASELPTLLRLLAARTADELVMEHIVDDAPIARQAVYEYTALLETTYLIHRVPAWSRNLTAKAKRHPKAYLTDAGLAAHLLRKDPDALARPADPATGKLMETFVAAELLRQSSWAESPIALHHYRDRAGPEVDLVLEAGDGRVVALEVKAGASFRRDAVKWLALLRDRCGRDFVHGYLLYAGPHALPLGDRLTALPIAALWEVR
ncbi:MAG: ATP-binding protein [Acidobacteria bacterium]|nr:ATP-binding protein [Acidobacteriota bacterium]